MRSLTGTGQGALPPIQGRTGEVPALVFPTQLGPNTAKSVDGAANSLDAATLLRAFRRRWRLALGLGLVGATVMAALAWRLLPPAKYMAESLLLVEAEQPKLIAATKEYRADPETDRRTQVALIKSYVLSKAVIQPEVEKLAIIREHTEPAEWLEGELKAEFTGKILRLALSTENPAEVTTIVKAVTRTYLNEVANKEKLQRLERNRSLEEHYNKLVKQLESKRSQMRAIATTLGSKDKQALSMQQRLAIARQSMAEEELLRTQSELKRSMAELKVLQFRRDHEPSVELAEPSNPNERAQLQRVIENDPAVQALLEKEAELNRVLGQNRRVARQASDPSRVVTQDALARTQKQRKALVERLRSELRENGGASPEVRNQAESSLESLENQIEVMTGLERELQDEVSKYTGDTRKLDSQALEIESIRDEIENAEQMAKLIGNELEILKIELQAPDRVKLLKDAKAPLGVDAGRRIKLAGLAGGGSFCAIVLLISFWEFQAHRIGSLDEVVNGLGIKIVGTVPMNRATKKWAGASAISDRDRIWKHQLVESVDATRIMLTHATRAESHRVVLVTSALGGEGKTSLSGHLATSLARSGQKTLLIDGDLRRPMVHHLYNQPAGPGFCELIREELSPDEVIRPTALNNLWVITAGSFDEHALAILAQPRSPVLFDQLRERFDYIIVDSAPILPVADTLLLGQHVDAAVFSILRDVSQLPRVQSAHDRMAALGVPILGAVVSGTSIDLHSQYYTIPI